MERTSLMREQGKGQRIEHGIMKRHEERYN